MQRVVRGPEYAPTLPRSGSTGEYVFRLQNLIKRGRGETAYWECTGGPLSLSETIATSTLTGTLAVTSGSKTVTGTGTSFKTELHPGQFVLLLDSSNNRSALLVVDAPVTSDTSFTASAAPTFSASGKTGYRLPVIFAVDDKRGTAIRGNVAKLDKGTLFSAGDGTFRLNGSTLGGSSLTLTRAPKISLFDPTTGNYTNYTLGMDTPGAPSAAAVAGGTKGMVASSYAIRVTPERLATLGFNNPSVRAQVTIAAGERVQITFAAVDSTHGQDAWGVWGTRYVDSQDTTGQNLVNGPWFRVGQVAESALDGSRRAIFEWLDGEVETQGAGLAGSLLTFDNDAPPSAEFVALFNGVPVWISTNGPGDTSPGPYIRPAKPSNVEAAPAGLGYPTSPPETILGVVAAQARLYLLTTNHLQIAQPTNDEFSPVRVSPFWKAGFKNPYQLVFTNGILYGATNSGPARSSGDGDSQETETTWAAPIEEFYRSWVRGHVLVAEDPSNEALCFFHSAYSLNSSGFWTTRVWLWGLTAQEWVGDFLLTSTTQDMIVSGVSTVGNNLDFLCGGRKSDNTVEIGTYRFDAGSGPTPYFLAPQFADSGVELHPKRLGPGFRVTGKLTSGSLKVYGARPGQSVPVADLEAGTNALATLSLSNGSNVTEGAYLKANVKNLKQHTVRISGTWDGNGARDRLEEVAYEHSVEGARR